MTHVYRLTARQKRQETLSNAQAMSRPSSAGAFMTAVKALRGGHARCHEAQTKLPAKLLSLTATTAGQDEQLTLAILTSWS